MCSIFKSLSMHQGQRSPNTSYILSHNRILGKYQTVLCYDKKSLKLYKVFDWYKYWLREHL